MWENIRCVTLILFDTGIYLLTCGMPKTSRNTRFIQIQIRSNSGYDVRAVPSSAAATRPRDPLRRGGALLFYHGQNAINNPMHYGGDVKSGVKYLVPWHSLAETAETSLP